MSSESGKAQNWQRLRLKISGAVQGVGFRPFVYVSAKSFHLSGFVRNNSGGVIVEIEGEENNLREFQRMLREKLPPLAHITAIEIKKIPAKFAARSRKREGFVSRQERRRRHSDGLFAARRAENRA